jgi:hypothetical protein
MLKRYMGEASIAISIKIGSDDVGGRQAKYLNLVASDYTDPNFL